MLEAEQNSDGLNSLSVLIVVVLHNLQPNASPAYRSLTTSIGCLTQPHNNIKVFLFDNTPGGQDPGPLPDRFQYFAAERNVGLAAAYNRALAIACNEGIGWLLTLDQDTSLPPNFLVKMRELALGWQEDASVGAIVPVLRHGTTLISPIYVNSLRNSVVPAGFTGLSKRELYALNSGAMLRVSSLLEIGGFCHEFWLDQLDLVLHHQLHRAGKRTYIAGEIQVQHELSLTDYRGLSPERLRNFLQSESAFFDLYKGNLENAVLTATLLFRLSKHLARRSNPDITSAILQAFKGRVFSTKAERIAEWKKKALDRAASSSPRVADQMETTRRTRVSVCMAAYNGEQFIAEQLRSILDQIAIDDEVVLVDDASTDATCRIIENLNDSRIRLTARKSNSGVLLAFEQAIQQAKGEILFLADQDDLWMPDKVATLLDAFRSNPEVDIVVSDASLINRDGALIGPSYYAVRGRFQAGILANILRCKYLGCTMAFRAHIRTRILPFPKGADVLHDWWIGTANSTAGGKTLYISRPLVQYRRHESNATGNKRLSFGRQIRIRWDLCRSLARVWINLPRRNEE